MNSPSSLNRRRFLGATAAATVGGSLTGISGLHAAEAIRETEHFWCRIAPQGPYIDSQRDNKAFGFGDGKVFLSEDNGHSWAHSADFADAENISFSCLLKNGNILFATRQKLWLSTDNLKTHQQVIVKDREGRDYLPHPPQDPNRPGWYFHPLDGIDTWDIDDSEMLVLGNYCNVLGGPVPVNIYYSRDSGQTVKIAYSFGRNPHFQEKGTEPGSMLGDPDNSVIGQHDYRRRRDSGRALRPCVDLRDGHHHFAGHGPDLGTVRPGGVCRAVSRSLSSKKQRRLVPDGPPQRMD